MGLTLDGPLTRNSSLIFSVRRSYLQLLFTVLKLPFFPTYNDYQLNYKSQESGNKLWYENYMDFGKWNIFGQMNKSFFNEHFDLMVNMKSDGSISNYTDNQGQLRYKLHVISNTAGTILPAIGIMIDL